MTGKLPRVSVVIPTHNRVEALKRALSELARQDFDADKLEVIVVADGCTDGTAQALAGMSSPYRLRLVEQDNAGAAMARNAGANAATGDLLIFMDDDIEPTPGFVTAHADIHAKSFFENLVLIGYSPPRIGLRSDFHSAAMLNWWETLFDEMDQPGHRFRYTDLLSGNFSIGKSYFDKIGQFDTELRCHEDYELGIRLIKGGAAFQFSREAWGIHRDSRSVPRMIDRQLEEGRADVRLARRHPEFAKLLRLLRGGRRYRMIVASDVAYSLLSGLYAILADAAQKLSMNRRWRTVTGQRYALAYWRGAEVEAGGRVALERLLREWRATPHEEQAIGEIDLAQGIEAAEAWLNDNRPSGALVRWGEQMIGLIPSEPSRERLHAAHLRPWLITDAADSLRSAIGLSELDRHLARPGRSSASSEIDWQRSGAAKPKPIARARSQAVTSPNP